MDLWKGCFGAEYVCLTEGRFSHSTLTRLHLTARRVLAEQHIALSEALDDPFHFFNDSASAPPPDKHENDGEHVGIIYTSLKVSSAVEKSIKLLTRLFEDEIQAGIRTGDAAVLPKIVVDGALEARFAYIPEHLEYIMFELLKNSMMAVMRQPLTSRDPVCIRVTIVEGPPDEDLIIRISDCGGGLPSTVLPTKTLTKSRKRLGHRVAAKKKKDLAADDGSTIEEHGDKRDMEAELALDDDLPSSIYVPVDDVQDENSFNEGQPAAPTEFTSPSSSTMTNKIGATDPLIAAVTSFSNIRRRLEMEEKRLSQEKPVKKSKDEVAESGAHFESPGGEKEAIQMGLRAGLKDHEQRASGIDSWAKLEALRNVGRFKGTVAEQMPKGEMAKNQKESGAPRTQSSSSHLKHSETGLGLPMTKIYTDFFGGSLSLRSLDGHGMDVFVRLPKLGTNKEAIEDIVS
jgi:hypothetical protein